MDITMPGVNGIEAVKLIIKDYPEAKIIMVSALNQRNMVFEALELGAKHYLIKPITPDSVISVANKVLGLKQPATSSIKEEEKEDAEKENTTIANSDPIEVALDVPFKIENNNSIFQITLTKHLTEESFNTLNQAIQGLLFVQPLSVTINFDLDSLSDSLLLKLSGIIEAIQRVKGTIKVVAQNKEFIKILKSKNLAGISDLLESM